MILAFSNARPSSSADRETGERAAAIYTFSNSTPASVIA
jgi:hypothetical protein